MPDYDNPIARKQSTGSVVRYYSMPEPDQWAFFKACAPAIFIKAGK